MAAQYKDLFLTHVKSDGHHAVTQGSNYVYLMVLPFQQLQQKMSPKDHTVALLCCGPEMIGALVLSTYWPELVV